MTALISELYFQSTKRRLRARKESFSSALIGGSKTVWSARGGASPRSAAKESRVAPGKHWINIAIVSHQRPSGRYVSASSGVSVWGFKSLCGPSEADQRLSVVVTSRRRVESSTPCASLSATVWARL